MIALPPPPHSGFGSEEDSLASVLRLQPKPPRQDMVKLMTNSSKILRYEAVLDNGLPEDQYRKFIIGVFLADDSVAVWEIRQRNSGQVEGKFAERCKRKNESTGDWFIPSDFFVGACVNLVAVPFHIIRADEYTLKY